MSKFKPGHRKVGGRKKGTPNVISIPELIKAIKKVQRDKQKKVLEHYLERCYSNDLLLDKMIDRFISKKLDISGMLGTMDVDDKSERAASIRAKLLKRLEDDAGPNE